MIAFLVEWWPVLLLGLIVVGAVVVEILWGHTLPGDRTDDFM